MRIIDKHGIGGFDWGGLKEGSIVVDVGGGTGAPAMLVARENPHLKIVIQERDNVVVQGTQVGISSGNLYLPGI